MSDPTKKCTCRCESCKITRARLRGIQKAKREGRMGRYPPIPREDVERYLSLRATGMRAVQAAEAIGVTVRGADKAAKRYRLA